MRIEPSLARAVEALASERAGKLVRITGVTAAGGGCINRAMTVALDDGGRLFVKSNPSPLPGMFEAEAAGLAALADAAARTGGGIHVPRPVGTGGGAGDPTGVDPFIVIEHVASGRRPGGFSERFGRAFAELHRLSVLEEDGAGAQRCGFDGDNYIGATPQPNDWSESWVEFFAERRLGYQLRLARDRGLADAQLTRLGDRLCARLGELIGEPEEPACLLHGDLWGGNYLVGEGGAAVLIDPAVYRGRREADLAMTTLFGGFDGRFYASYEERWPLAPGSADRLEIYKLYHLLNHLNLFGGGYRGGCLAILERFAG